MGKFKTLLLLLFFILSLGYSDKVNIITITPETTAKEFFTTYLKLNQNIDLLITIGTDSIKINRSCPDLSIFSSAELRQLDFTISQKYEVSAFHGMRQIDDFAEAVAIYRKEYSKGTEYPDYGVASVSIFKEQKVLIYIPFIKLISQEVKCLFFGLLG